MCVEKQCKGGCMKWRQIRENKLLANMDSPLSPETVQSELYTYCRLFMGQIFKPNIRETASSSVNKHTPCTNISFKHENTEPLVRIICENETRRVI